MSTAQAIGSGVAGAVVLTALHESIRHLVPEAPRMEKIGMQLIKKGNKLAGKKVPKEDKLYNQALAGDLALNSAFYSLVGSGRNSWIRGLIVGAGAGLAAVFLPKALDLKEKASSRTGNTVAMTIGLYTLAGLAAAGMSAILNDDDD